MFPAGRPDLRTRRLQLESGIHVRVVECGEDGAPVILMLPGWGCSAYVFRENLAPLAAAGFHAIAVDLKGHGLSDKPEAAEEYRLEPMREHVMEIMDALGEETFLATGLSMGAALAAHVAAKSPHRVRALAMVSPVGFAGIPGHPALRFMTPSPLTPVLPWAATRGVIGLMLRAVNGRLRRITSRDIDEYWAPTQFPEFTKAMRHLLHEFTWRAPFEPLGVRCMMISGARDRLVGAAADSYRRAMPELRHIEVPEAGHVVFDEAPSVVNSALVEFFRSAPGGR